ncbi:hypothetical protein ACET3Z_010176 [Daucus carota]
MAYSILDIAGDGRGCLQWYGDLVDIRELSGGGQDLYVRVALSDSDESKGKDGSKLLIILVVLVASVLLVLMLAFYLWKKRRNTLLTRPDGSLESNSMKEFNSESHKEDLDLPFFRLSTLAEATDHFAISNKLGQGGFGPVFKKTRTRQTQTESSVHMATCPQMAAEIEDSFTETTVIIYLGMHGDYIKKAAASLATLDKKASESKQYVKCRTLRGVLDLDVVLTGIEEKENGQVLYIRMAASELAKKGRSKVWFVWIPILMTVTMMCVCLWVIRNKKRNKKKKQTEGITNPYFENGGSIEMGAEDLELPLFDFTTLANATNGFSKYSMLGEGGFGPVYKGMLDDGKEIAVKRLSKDSRQGLKEFKNEVSCIARLQHRNLVKLLGCSVQEGERMLVYEYMPNKSLDSFIFGKMKGYTLDWPTRYNIINGIARGLLYLHQDSRLRIIHRDLKASNVLLDLEMNPKISDFGTARICGETETGSNTTRVVGTYGYMSPEYATDGIFSVKSDVYSFGVLVLETVNGKRNKNFAHLDHNLNLLGHAWRTYIDGNVLDLVDEVIEDLSPEHQYEVFRAIQIGLLCVQQYPADRPTMATVVLMLTSELPLPQPKQPGFFIERNVHEGDSSSCSSNYCSVTAIAPR